MGWWHERTKRLVGQRVLELSKILKYFKSLVCKTDVGGQLQNLIVRFWLVKVQLGCYTGTYQSHAVV